MCGADQASLHGLDALGRITSACAEQTRRRNPREGQTTDHLRVCGADLENSNVFASLFGSPPRVRSRLFDAKAINPPDGITSACAEQTWRRSLRPSVFWDHLRVCGADFDGSQSGDWTAGSPPRVRSRLRTVRVGPAHGGITSACAEQTGVEEHFGLLYQGSPPRVRSRPGQPLARDFTLGITSACAEQTMILPSYLVLGWDHLRVCGADFDASRPAQGSAGSPPRVRSRRSRPG